MVKYLHKYSSEDDFIEDYNDDMTSVVESFECSAGTFNYLGKGRWYPVTFWKNGSTELMTPSREVAVGGVAGNPLNTGEKYEITAVSSDGGVVTAFTCSVGTFVYDREGFFCGNANQNYYSWGNGQRQVLITQFRNAAVGDGDGQSTGAHDLNNNTSVEITQVNTVSRDPAYHEPWVSLTKVNRIEYDYNWYNHVGEVDVYDDGTEDYIGKMHLWKREDGRYLIISKTETPGTNDTIYTPRISDGKYHITASLMTATDIQRGTRVDYNRRIWMDLSNYERPGSVSPVSLGTVPEPKPSNHGKVYVKEPDGKTYPYGYRKQGNGVVVLGRYNPDLSGYEIIISADGTAQWRYKRGLS